MCCKGKKPCWSSSVAAPVPTADCADEAGSPNSYLYDIYDRDRGWYTLGTNVEIASNRLQVTTTSATSTAATTYLKLLSRVPVSAEAVSMEASMACSLASAYDNTEFFGITLGGLYLGIGYRAATASFRAGVATSGNFYNGVKLYDAPSPIANNTAGVVILKMVASATQVLCYIDGALVYTHGSPVSIATANMTSLKPMNAYSGGIQREYARFNYLKYFGYNLPVNC